MKRNPNSYIYNQHNIIIQKTSCNNIKATKNKRHKDNQNHGHTMTEPHL